MFEIIEGNSQGLADVDWFIQRLNSHSYFEPENDVFVTRAPGRLDVMGGIADYSGSLVLEMPIAEATFAAIQLNQSDRIEIISLEPGDVDLLEFSLPVHDVQNDKQAIDLNAARDYFVDRDSGNWAAYVAGVFFVLVRELGSRFEKGAKIFIASRVPVGKGVSSSAALEVAAMQAVCAAYQIHLAPRELALLCQKVENQIVGAPCGVMDQMTSNCGETGKLLALVCQPAEIRSQIEIPNAIEFWGIDSGVRHAVSGSDYSSVRIGAFMGYRIIAELAGLRVRRNASGIVEINDTRWNGNLANVNPAEYEKEFMQRMPDSMKGHEFISKYIGTTDKVTSIESEKTYAIKAPTEHAIYENWRVNRFADLLSGCVTNDILTEAGELMFDSHAGYMACGLTEPRTERIVELVRANKIGGLFGARITGGGSGGTVAVLARCRSEEAIAKLTKQVADETGDRPYVFHGSSPGSSQFGHVRLRYQKDAEA